MTNNDNRLKQFWNWGHNCAVLNMNRLQAEDVLIDNRFQREFITAEEKEKFLLGFCHRPLQWPKAQRPFITLRPHSDNISIRKYARKKKADPQAKERGAHWWRYTEAGQELRRKMSLKRQNKARYRRTAI